MLAGSAVMRTTLARGGSFSPAGWAALSAAETGPAAQAARTIRLNPKNHPLRPGLRSIFMTKPRVRLWLFMLFLGVRLQRYRHKLLDQLPRLGVIEPHYAVEAGRGDLLAVPA